MDVGSVCVDNRPSPKMDVLSVILCVCIAYLLLVYNLSVILNFHQNSKVLRKRFFAKFTTVIS